MKNIKAIIFDCDGTLVDSEYKHYLAWKHAAQKQGNDLTLEEYYFYVGNASEANATLLSKKIGRDCFQEIVRDKTAYYRKLQTGGISPIQPTVDFVHRLAKEKKRLGLKLGIASAVSKDEILVNLRNLEIESFFDIILSGYDDLGDYNDPEGVNKPKPYIYLHAAKLLNLVPSQCVVIEDSYTGVTAGVDAGCIVVAVPNSYTASHDLSRAHVIIESLAGINVDDFLARIATTP